MSERDRLTQDGELVDRLLEAVGRDAELSESMRLAWEQRFRHALDKAGRTRHYRQWAMVAGLVVCALLLGVVVRNWMQSEPAVPTVQANITQVVNRAELASSASARSTAATPGQMLRSGDRLKSASASFVALEYRGAQLRLDENGELLFLDGAIRLVDGALYVDSHPGRKPSRPLTLRAGEALIRNLGTQFMVIHNRFTKEVISTVREGSIEVSIGDQKMRAVASPGAAAAIRVQGDQAPELEPIETGPVDWPWIHAVATPFKLDGSSVAAYLSWLSRETGLQLSYSEPAVRERARQAKIFGELPELPPLEALRLVMATTSLEAEIQSNGELRVHVRESRSHGSYNESKAAAAP